MLAHAKLAPLALGVVVVAAGVTRATVGCTYTPYRCLLPFRIHSRRGDWVSIALFVPYTCGCEVVVDPVVLTDVHVAISLFLRY